MKLSPEGIAVAHYFEQLRLTAYPDPGSKDGTPWTIGWGHTGPEVHKDLVWTKEQADEAFLKDIGQAQTTIQYIVSKQLNQGQYDALTLLIYNIGGAAFTTSTLCRKLNTGDYHGASMEFRRWNKNDGKPMLGLTRRRAAEECLFNGMSANDAILTAANIKEIA